MGDRTKKNGDEGEPEKRERETQGILFCRLGGGGEKNGARRGRKKRRDGVVIFMIFTRGREGGN